MYKKDYREKKVHTLRWRFFFIEILRENVFHSEYIDNYIRYNYEDKNLFLIMIN